MGGRGRKSGIVRQMSIDWYKKKLAVESVLEKCAKLRGTIINEGNDDITLPLMYRKCACCGEYTIHIGTKYEICSICGWIDDPYQNKHPDSLDGENALTLSQARSQLHL